jgi:hypothetical protein
LVTATEGVTLIPVFIALLIDLGASQVMLLLIPQAVNHRILMQFVTLLRDRQKDAFRQRSPLLLQARTTCMNHLLADEPARASCELRCLITATCAATLTLALCLLAACVSPAGVI